jgi:FAD:protein FMN transferase
VTSVGTTDTATARYVEHVMGMPISLALRGRHTDDDAARAAWAEAMAVLHEVDRVFSTYRPESFVSRLGRSEIGLEDCPPEVAEVMELGAAAERDSGGAFSIRLPGPDGTSALDPSGVVKGWAAERAAEPLRTLDDTDFCLSAGGDMTCRTLDPTSLPWRIDGEDPADPTRVLAVVPVFTGAVATSRHRPPRPAPGGRPHRPPAVRGRLHHRGGGVAHLGRHRRHRGVRPRGGRRPLARDPAGPLRPGRLGRRHDHHRSARPLLTPPPTPDRTDPP